MHAPICLLWYNTLFWFPSCTVTKPIFRISWIRAIFVREAGCYYSMYHHILGHNQTLGCNALVFVVKLLHLWCVSRRLWGTIAKVRQCMSHTQKFLASLHLDSSPISLLSALPQSAYLVYQSMYNRSDTMQPKLFGIQIWWYQTFLII